jgi:nucleoside-diphosphate-sugar epimerase
MDAVLSYRPPVIAGSPYSAQDLIAVDDVVQATLMAAETPRVSGKVYNIGRGRPTTAAEVVVTLNGLLGTRIEPDYSQAPKPEIGPLADIALAEVDLGFSPTTSLVHGLKRCLATGAGRAAQ